MAASLLMGCLQDGQWAVTLAALISADYVSEFAAGAADRDRYGSIARKGATLLLRKKCYIARLKRQIHCVYSA